MKVLLLEDDENMRLSDRILRSVKDVYKRHRLYGCNCTQHYRLVFLNNMRHKSFHGLGYVVRSCVPGHEFAINGEGAKHWCGNRMLKKILNLEPGGLVLI